VCARNRCNGGTEWSDCARAGVLYGDGEPVSPGGGVLRNRTRRRRESARARALELGGGGGGGATARGDSDTDRSQTTAAPAATLDGMNGGS